MTSTVDRQRDSFCVRQKELEDSSYEVKLRQFADGKRLGRLASAVRDCAHALCDVCGSDLPRTLYGLMDGTSGRYYFVGQNCLARLMESGQVARTRYRQLAAAAYRLEMETRQNNRTRSHTVAPGTVLTPRSASRLAEEFAGLRRTMLVVESGDEYQAVARLSDGQRTVAGRAKEPLWRLAWSRQDGALVLERVRRPRRALAACVLKAYGSALNLWRAGASPVQKDSEEEPRAWQER